ncbi:hypothetical protein GBAR_LOCUS15989 [Geodia barretti]|uniref:Death domain-containing protein n=1 Tax=Geodia barretti TaxID=519541 RepID=A0AA35SFQ8_GEOBA|nr:hypothetical protein GBAR_LOCUS15989 [Geodia barretti]
MVDQRPIIAGRMNVTETTTPAITVSTSSDGRVSSVAIGVSATVLCIIVILVILAVVTLILWRKSHKSGSQDDGGANPKKDEHAEGEAKPPFSGESFHQRQDSGISMSTHPGEANPPRSLMSSLDSGINSTPPLMSKQKGMYTDVEPSTSGVQPPIPEDSRVQYQEIDIRTTHKMARSQYADLGPLPTNRPKPPKIETKTQNPYVDVLPHTATPVNDNSNGDKKNADKATPKGPPTVESVMSLLWGVVGRWKEIAEGLEFDEDLIDEIDTNNDMDEGCLQVCVEMWVSKLQPSWEKLSHVLRDLGEVELACQAWSEDQDPDVGGGAANFEVKPQESTAQSGGTATVASELSAPQNDVNEVGESRGSKITMFLWDTKSSGKYDRPYEEPLVKSFKENCGHKDNVGSKSDDIINNESKDVIGNGVEEENNNIELSYLTTKCMQEQCENGEAAVFALGSVDHSVSEVLKVADVHHVFDRVLPLQMATDASGLAKVAAKLHSEGCGGGGSADKTTYGIQIQQQAVECKTTPPRLTDGESQKPAVAGANRVPSTVTKFKKRKKRKRRRRRSLSRHLQVKSMASLSVQGRRPRNRVGTCPSTNGYCTCVLFST